MVQDIGRKVSKNHTRTAWVLKLDIKKFFASIDHSVLLEILGKYISTPTSSPPYQGGEREGVMWLLERVIESFSVRPLPQSLPRPGEGSKIGLPLGNLTSQLFCNVYMNQLDQFAKHRLKAKYYLRYADDFVLMSENSSWLQEQIPVISGFLEKHLRLSLHPDKIFLKTLASGMDFLGWVHFPHHRIVRRATLSACSDALKNIRLTKPCGRI